MTTKCACEMTTPELLAANTAGRNAIKAILIEDTGRGWKVTEYTAAAAGLGSDHITMQSAMSEVERLIVKVRRDDTQPAPPGYVITDPEQVARELTGKR